MSRTYKTSPKAKQQKIYRCTCEGCVAGRNHKNSKKPTIKIELAVLEDWLENEHNLGLVIK